MARDSQRGIRDIGHIDSDARLGANQELVGTSRGEGSILQIGPYETAVMVCDRVITSGKGILSRSGRAVAAGERIGPTRNSGSAQGRSRIPACGGEIA